MTWLFLSLACAFFAAITATLSKLLLRKKKALFVGWALFVSTLPFLFIAFRIYRPDVPLGQGIWKTIAIMAPLEIIAIFLYMKALKLSPLSLVFPFLGFTPVFSILTSFIILRERLSATAILGVCLVSVGAYTLNAHLFKKGFLEPIRNIYREKGSMLMVVVAFIYSITATLGKKAVLLSDPISFPLIYFAIVALLLTPLMYAENKASGIRLERAEILMIAAVGCSLGISMIFHFKAITLTKVSYMLSVKRLSLVLSVIYGAVIFKERNIGYRLLGSVIMLGGITILAICANL